MSNPVFTDISNRWFVNTFCRYTQLNDQTVLWFHVIWVYGISTIVGYLMPNPVFTYILNIWFVKTFCRYTQLNDQTVQFLTIHFSVSQQS